MADPHDPHITKTNPPIETTGKHTHEMFYLAGPASGVLFEQTRDHWRGSTIRQAHIQPRQPVEAKVTFRLRE